ncbi:uncharacterized protein ACRADG_011171 [Cochliomyia hominivorax]
MFLCITVNYIVKYNAGVAVVAMTNAETTNPNFPEYDWNEMEKSYILSSFFWGYFVTQFPGGFLCKRFGAKLIMLISTLGSAAVAVLIPLTVDWGGWQIYCGVRVVQGLFQGLLFPCVHAHLATWCPVNERNRLGALANTGIECGTLLAMFFSGILAASSLGWPGISYMSCGVGVFWCILWVIFAANSPNESKLISAAEKLYIEHSKKALKEHEVDSPPKNIPVPWKAILTSWPFWALLVVRSANSWGYSTLQAEIPTYMNAILGMDMKSNALFSALPYFTMWIMAYVYIVVADILLNSKILSLSGIRKMFNSLASWIPAIGLILVGFVEKEQKTLAVILMTINVGVNSGATIGSALNTIDLSPNHAGILMGLVNTSANIVPILTPLLVGVIVDDETDRTEWQIVFAISAAIFFFANLFYVIFGSTKLQPWDDENFLLTKEIQNEDGQKKRSIERPRLGIRHLQTLLIFLNITVIYISRLNIGVALVAMTNAATSNPDFPEFDWNDKEKSYIHSSFYWGYVVTQFPGGAISKRFGAKITMLISTFLSALLSAITPWSVSWGGWQAFCVIRIIQGLCQGSLFPCIHEHLAKWSPLEERNRLGALSQTGIEFGTVMALGMSGIIADGPLGWPGISYVSASLCFVWCVLWLVFGANNATESRFISEAEKRYIEASLEHSDDFHKTKIPVPWKAIWLSVPFIALLLARCAEGYGLNILQTQIPSYMNGVLGMNIKSNALFSALPFLAMWGMSYIYVLLADIIQHKKLLSLTGIRKSANTIAYWIPAAGLIGIGFLDENNKTLAIVLLTLLVGVNSGATIGSTLNTIDLSPNHAGILMGIVNTIANFMPLIAPLVVGVMVSDSSSRSQWQIVFIIAAVIFFFGNLFYIIFGTAITQPWDAEDFLKPKDTESSSKRESQVTAEVQVDVKEVDKDAAPASSKESEAQESSLNTQSK